MATCPKSCKKKGGVCEGKKCCIPKIAHTGADEGTGCNHKSVAVEWKGFKAWLLKFYTGNKVKVGKKKMTLKDLLKDKKTAKTFFDDDERLNYILKAKQMVVALQSKGKYDKPSGKDFDTIANGMRLAEEQIEEAGQKVKHPYEPRTTAYSQGAWDKNAKFAPEGYELDSFEIGTESAICEDCGEIHELNDEYEFGPHDEYEEVDTLYKDKCMSKKAYNAWKGKKSYKAVVKHLQKLAKKYKKDQYISEALLNVQALFAPYDKNNCGAINDSLLPAVISSINTLIGLMGKSTADPKGILSDFVKSLSDKGKLFRRLQEKEQSGYDLGTLVGYSSYEAIPDYLRNSLKPKKSVHPVYGKLRY